jgi:hypothetical protein
MWNLVDPYFTGFPAPEIHRRVIMHKNIPHERIPQPHRPPVPPQRSHHKIPHRIMRDCSDDNSPFLQTPQRPHPERSKIFLVAGEKNGNLGFAEVVPGNG